MKVHPNQCSCKKCINVRKQDRRALKCVWLLYITIFIIGALF
jgi:hypothetical protein